MITAVIIDDEQYCIDDLKYLINKQELPVKVVAGATSGEQGIEIINQLKPQLVFLDIVMPDMSGFEMLEKIAEVNFSLVITTSVDKYAIQAIRASAIDFLVKPIKTEELSNAVSRIMQKHEIPGKPQLNLLREQLHPKSKINKIAITVSDGIQLVKLDDILYLKSDGNYTTFFLKDGKNILVTRQIGKFEEMLSVESFFRIHSSFLINLNCVSKYVRSDGGYVVMENGENISVARNRKDEFFDLIGKI